MTRTCTWDDCNATEKLSEVNIYAEDGQEVGSELYCSRHKTLGIALNDPAMKEKLSQAEKKIFERATKKTVSGENDFFKNAAEQYRAQGYAAGSMDSLKHAQARTAVPRSVPQTLGQFETYNTTPADDLSLMSAVKPIWDKLNQHEHVLAESLGGNAGSLGDMLRKAKQNLTPNPASTPSFKKKYLWWGVGILALLVVGWMFIGTIQSGVEAGIAQGIADAISQNPELASSASAPVMNAVLPTDLSSFQNSVGVYPASQYATRR